MISPKAIEPIIVRTINADDRQIWEPLWNGYLEFYGKHISQQTTDLYWHRLTRSGDIHGLIALSRGGEGVGLVHFFYHLSTSTIGGNCYVQDLFVSVSARRCGAGRELMLAAVDAARVVRAPPSFTGRPKSSTALRDGFMSRSPNALRLLDTTLNSKEERGAGGMKSTFFPTAIFKDGIRFDTGKLLDSVKGHYGEY